MLSEELLALAAKVRKTKAESQTIEVKAAHEGCPQRLYDTLSSFSNQDEGGVILFGLDERRDFEPVGVYDAQDLQKHVAEQCDQMQPKIRALFTIASVGEATIVSAEIPATDVADRPCFYAGKGRVKGSFVRVGESDEPMTEYEIYSYEAFRRKYQDEVETVDRAPRDAFDPVRLSTYLQRLREEKPRFRSLEDAQCLELTGMLRDGAPTVAGVMLLSSYPQAFFPQLSVIATVVPGVEAGAVGEGGDRFLDNERLEGPLPEQLEDAIAFVRKNMRRTTRIDPVTGRRADREEYPVEAVRELVVNALIHRDYSVHTQGMPIQLQMFDNRIVITSPGGLYGRLSVDDLGKVQPDTRNPVIATAMETLGETENRYSGIPTVRRIMREEGRPDPVFESFRGEFRATLANGHASGRSAGAGSAPQNGRAGQILSFCSVPRSREEIAEFLGIGVNYASARYVNPLVKQGLLAMTIPETPRSHRQRFVAVGAMK